LIEITFLGTGTSMGVPVISCNCPACISDDAKDKRLRASVMIKINNKVIVIDTGPDFRQQMLRENVKRIDALLITHSHKDHIAGLDDVRPYNYIMNKAMDLYASTDTMNAIKKEFSYVFLKEKYPGVPDINLIEINDKSFFIDDIKVTPIKLLHHKMNVLGFRIGNFSYITDTNYISDNELQKMMHSEVVVISALRKKKHLSHFSLDEALNILKILNPQKAYITHISHQMGKHEDVQKELPARVYFAYDGLKIIV